MGWADEEKVVYRLVTKVASRTYWGVGFLYAVQVLVERHVSSAELDKGSGLAAGEGCDELGEVLAGHEGIDAAAQGLAVIDAGHYGIEHIFIEDMREFLEKRLEGVSVTADPPRDPFLIV